MLARNGDLNGVVRSLTQLEAKFNTRFGYPYVFLNEEPFSDDLSAKSWLGLIPKEHWYQPAWIDEEKARASRKKMEEEHVIMGGTGSVPYRNMCRFNSGFFFRHELLDKYRYYWHPTSVFFCTLSYDPFLFMQDEGKKYGFTISLPTTDGGETYNGFHFWSNFEIGDPRPHLDSKGGFYYERWGDAPPLFARKDQIHFFDDIGYRHEPFQHCPQEPAHSREQCDCKIDDNFDREGWSCLNRYDRMFT
ncbi:glycosyltransferase family 15 protein [Mycena olivaceomarginata]|nr:glycosyltransferase family 15 protein [Mycena olivaceomarginata]